MKIANLMTIRKFTNNIARVQNTNISIYAWILLFNNVVSISNIFQVNKNTTQPIGCKNR